MDRTWKLNLLLAYLLRRKEIYPFEELEPLLGLWGFGVLVIVANSMNWLGAVLICFLPLCGLFYIPAMFVPMVVGHTSASLSSRLMSNQSYELLTLTPISDET